MADNITGAHFGAKTEFFKSSVLPTVRYEGRGVKKAVQNFEALFIQDLLKVMRKSMGKGDGGGLLNTTNSKDIYTSMIDAELAKDLARGRGLGLGQMLLRQFDKDGDLGEQKVLKEVKIKPLAAKDVFVGAERTGGKVGAKEEGARQSASAKTSLYEMPVEGVVSSGYGMRKHPISKEVGFHHGMDISTHEGAPVYPVATGRVVNVGNSNSYGNFVDIMHEDGMVSRYAHLHSSTVERGEVVVTTRPFAFVGNSGGSTAAHLHLEVLRDGRSVNPQEFL